MKNLIRSFAVLAAILSFAACQKEIEGSKEETKLTHTVSFVTGSPETKTIANINRVEGTVNYEWTDDDQDRFTLYEIQGNGTYKTADLTTGTLIKNGEKAGQMYIEATFDGAAIPGSSYIAIFNSAVKTEQSADGDNYDQESDVLVSEIVAPNSIEGEQLYLRFKREVAICEVNLKGLNQGTHVLSTKIESLDEGVYLAGSVEDGTLVGSGKAIVVNTLNEINSEVGTLRFVSLPIANANLKFSVETTTDGNEVDALYTKELGKPITFPKGDLKAFNVSSWTKITKGTMWSYTFGSKQFDTDKLSVLLDGKTWTLPSSASSGYFNYDGTKGQQLGSSGKPFSSIFLTSNFGADYGVKTLKVKAAVAKDGITSMSVSVGGVTLKCNNNTSVSVAESSTDYTFSSNKILTGDIVISFSQPTTEKAIYVKEIAVNPIPVCDAPVADHAAGEILAGTEVELTTTTPGASIYYTLNGEDPTTSSTLYTSKVVISDNCTLKAIATKDAMANSTVVSYAYTIPVCENPEITFVSGHVELQSATEGAGFRYVIGAADVSDPTESSSIYDSDNKPAISNNQFVKAYAFKAGYKNSAVSSKKYVSGGSMLTLTKGSFVFAGGSGYKTATASEVGDDKISFSAENVMISNSNIQGQANNMRIWNTTSLGTIQKVIVTRANNNSSTCYYGNSSKPVNSSNTISKSTSGSVDTYDFASVDAEYFTLACGSSYTLISSIEVQYALLPQVDAPTSVSATAYPYDKKITVSWTDAANATSYYIYDGDTKLNPDDAVASGVGSYDITNITWDKTYSIKVEAVADGYRSNKNATPVTRSVEQPGLAMVTGVGHAEDLSNQNAQKTTISWTAVTPDSKAGSVTYNVWNGSTKLNSTPVSETSFEFSIAYGTEYSIFVEAVPSNENVKSSKTTSPVSFSVADPRIKEFSVNPLIVDGDDTVAKEGGVVTVNVVADPSVQWTISNVADGLTVKNADLSAVVSSGNGNATLKVVVASNSKAARSLSFTVASSNSASVPVVQTSYDVKISQAAGAEPDPVTVTETFEDQDSDSTYNGQKTYEANKSNAGISWYVEHGTVSTTACLTGTKSMHMRAYYAKGSNTTTWNGALPYLESKTPLKGLKSVSFNAAIGTNNTLKYNTYYSTDGNNWTQIDSNESLSTTTKKYSFDIPNSDKSTGYYIKIAVSTSSTHANSPKKAGNITFRVDDIELTYYE